MRVRLGTLSQKLLDSTLSCGASSLNFDVFVFQFTVSIASICSISFSGDFSSVLSLKSAKIDSATELTSESSLLEIGNKRGMKFLYLAGARAKSSPPRIVSLECQNR